MNRLILAGLLTLSTATLQARTQIVPRQSPPPPPAANDSSNASTPPSGHQGSGNPRPGAIAPAPTTPSSGPPTSIIRRPNAGAPPSGPIVQDPGVVQEMRRGRRGNIVPDKYYWHNRGGKRYVHYYDRHRHWYGFYDGPRFHWTSWHGDRWWWYDAHFHRWNYWHAGHWWWPASTGAVFVYRDGDYRPYEEAGLAVESPVAAAPPTAPEALPATPQGGSWTSPDNRRMVQILGARAEAFLYDATLPDAPRFLKYLGRDVEKVRFAGGTDGKPLRILLDHKDGGFALLNANGEPVENSPSGR